MGRADYSRWVRANPSVVGLLVVLSGAPACRSVNGGAPVLVQPGAPGEAVRAISPANATDVSRTSATAADVRFMQEMITHHAQAVEMTALLRTRTARADMRLLASRIEASQEDEMAFMRRWLEARGQAAPDAHAHHEDGATLMRGMLTAEEMTRLAAAAGRDIDRLFLGGMSKHHAVALEMVASLFAVPGAGQDTEIFAFASD